MKKIKLIALMLVLALALVGCTAKPNVDGVKIAQDPQDVLSQNTPQPATEPPQEEDLGLSGMEEEGIDPFGDGYTDPEGQGSLEDPSSGVGTYDLSTPYPYTGATPIVLSPADAATATIPPKMTFEYMAYSVPTLGLTFEAPVGWTESNPDENTFVITDPVQRDGVNATITFTRDVKADPYTLNDLRELVKSEMNTMSTRDFTSFSGSNLDTRTILEKDGIYADYRGVLPDGAVVRGRFHAVAVGKVIYTIHLRHSANYNTSYLDIHGQIRNTIQVTQ